MSDQSKNYAWIKNCPLCSQGRLMIAKEETSGKLYIVCEECESEWNSPEDVSKNNTLARDTFGESAYLTQEELQDHPWKQFLHS